MAEPFLGELRIMSFGYAPQGWAMCNGQFLPINQNQALFSLLGTMYGGNGQTTFALPDLRGRVPLHVGTGFLQGQAGGEQAHTLTLGEMPTHVHVLNASNVQGNSVNPNFNSVGQILAQDPGKAYDTAFNPGAAALNPASVTNVGGSQAHLNMQPFLTLTFCIALIGIFPSRN
jgi:microcystin-dependent protein